MEIINQRVLVFENRPDLGGMVARRIAALGARVTLFRHRTSAPLMGHGPYSFEIVELKSFWQAEIEEWLNRLTEPIDHLLVGQFAHLKPFAEAGAANYPAWLSGGYGWAYDVARRGKPPVAQSVAFFANSVTAPANGESAAVPGEVEADYVRWLEQAVRPVRVNAVRTEPIPSPLPGARTARTSHRLIIQEDVTEALLFLIRNPHVSGSVLHIDQRHSLDISESERVVYHERTAAVNRELDN